MKKNKYYQEGYRVGLDACHELEDEKDFLSFLTLEDIDFTDSEMDYLISEFGQKMYEKHYIEIKEGYFDGWNSLIDRLRGC